MKLLTIFFSLLVIFNVNAQQYNLTHYSLSEEVLPKNVTSIAQDQIGFLWFGTSDGQIFKFDGLSFSSYNEILGIHAACIYSVAADMNGYIWIGSNEGLYICKGRRKIFHLKSTLKDPIVPVIIIVRKQVIWLVTDKNRIYKYIFEQNPKESLNKPEITLSDTNEKINCLFVDSSGILYIGLSNSLLHNKSASLTKIPIELRKKHLPIDIRSISQDVEGNVYFLSHNHGLFKYQNDEIELINTRNKFSADNFSSMICTPDGIIWIGTNKGIIRLTEDRIETITTNNGLLNDEIKLIFQDSEQNVWIVSADDGLSKFGSERFKYYNERNQISDIIYSIDIDIDGNLWLGTSNPGLTKFDGKKIILYQSNHVYGSNIIRTVLCDSDGDVWLAPDKKGLFQLKNNVFDPVRLDFHEDYHVSSITEDNTGNIWVSAHASESRIFRINKQSRTPDETISFGNKTIISTLHIDSTQVLWIGLEKDGLLKINLNDTLRIIDTIKNIPSKKINCITSRKGKVFIGTRDKGVFQIDDNSISIDKKSGLISNNVKSLLFDCEGNLWVASDIGLNKIPIYKSPFKVFSYGKNEGFNPKQNLRNASSLHKDGSLWFGTENGLFKYTPDLDHSSKIKPTLLFTDIRINYVSVYDTGSNIKPNALYNELPKDLILPHDSNAICFDFLGLTLINPNAVRYTWKLEPIETEFRPLTYESRASYPYLPPDTYTFSVKAYGENADENDAVEKKYSFVISKPPVPIHELLFLPMLTLVLILSLYILLRIIVKRIKKERIEKELLKLEQATHRLRMNPHFIFNALNSIQGFISTKETMEAKAFLAKFAKLMRFTLEKATEEFILLSEEVEYIENYMILEQLRMNDKFDYSIVIDNQISPEEIRVPTMIIQPIVENAIVHGIKQKEGKGLIKISFTIDSGHIICSITDNGIGRKNAGELKNLSVSKHQSAALKITEERLLGLYRKRGKYKVVTVEDLYDENSKPAGTKVILRILISQS